MLAVMLPPPKRLGLLIVVSGPSGSGKTTLCRQACDGERAIFSVSCTTRAARPGEEHGKDYFFLEEADFLARVERGEMFEYAQVHGRWYGTLKSFVYDNLRRGIDVFMDIDVQGAAQVRACQDELVAKCYTDLFVMPPSLDELRARLAARGTEDEQALALRLRNAEAEMRGWRDYRYCLVSDTRESDSARFAAYLSSERMRSSLRE